MGEKHGSRLLPVLGLVLPYPENFGGGVAREHGVAGQFDHLGLPSEDLGQFGALGDRGGIAPEFGWADDLVLRVQEHEAVLLAAHTDSGDLCLERAEFGKNLGDGFLHGGDPDRGILLHGTFTLRLHKAIGLLGTGKYLSRVDV